MSRVANIEITSEYSGKRLDIALSALSEITSRTRVAALCEQGAVKLGDTAVSKKHIVSEGERYSIAIPDLREPTAQAQSIPLDIVYEDDSLLVVNKPKGMVVHPAPGNEDGTLVNALMHHCGESLSGIGGELRPGIVHRIDKDTSGLLVVAKDDTTHTELSRQIAQHSIDRYYLAIAHGSFSDTSFTIDKPIARHRADRKRMAVDHSGRAAVTHVEVLAEYNKYSLLRCRLETGRTHQIRVHLAHISHPLVGDTVYLGARKTIPNLQGQCLHAGGLGFVHPKTGKRLLFKVAPPDYFIELAKKLELCTGAASLMLEDIVC